MSVPDVRSKAVNGFPEHREQVSSTSDNPISWDCSDQVVCTEEPLKTSTVQDLSPKTPNHIFMDVNGFDAARIMTFAGVFPHSFQDGRFYPKLPENHLQKGKFSEYFMETERAQARTLYNLSHQYGPPNIDDSSSDEDDSHDTSTGGGCHLPKLYKCHYCDYETKFRSELRDHLKIHEEHPFKCSQCGSVFSNNGNLKRHMVIHSGELPFECPECSESFRTKHYLSVHLLKHSNKRPFGCKFCSASFFQKSHLKKHLLKHENLSPQCPYCEFTSAIPTTLRSHMLTHTGKHKFQCDLCDYSCKQSGHLRQHMKKHVESRPHKCLQCGCCFKTENNLQRHSVTHSKDRKYKCIYCDFTSDHTSNLEKHFVVHSSEKASHTE